MTQFAVYIIQSQKTGRYYIGHTNNLPRRLSQHSAGRTRSLKNKGPFTVIHRELFPTKQEAYSREMKIKSFKGGIQFKNLVKYARSRDTQAANEA